MSPSWTTKARPAPLALRRTRRRFWSSLGLAGGGVVAVGAIIGHVRHSQDTAWCRTVTPATIMVKGVSQPIDPQILDSARAGCVAQRRAQRGIFGAVWKSGGEEMAVCA